MTQLKKFLKKYAYRLPSELVAQTPAKPRDAARLLVYNRRSKKIKFDRFFNLAGYLPKNAVLVFNQTKVWPARLTIIKPTGGKVKILYIDADKKSGLIKIISNKHLPVGERVDFLRGRAKNQHLKVIGKKNGFYYLRPNFPISQITKIMTKYGVTPLPPYIKNSPLSEIQRRKEYQSVFAKTGLSVAAPTASLHFTKRLINQLQKQGIGIAFVQLDVNLGTFAPLREEQIKSGKLHQEFYRINKSTARFLNQAKAAGRPIIAVGTTVVRTLESAAKNQRLTKLTGNTDLFIKENYKFKFVDGLITNFHVPKSSLLMLTSAFVGRKKLFDLYKQAISKNFRFFSFGDGMLIF